MLFHLIVYKANSTYYRCTKGCCGPEAKYDSEFILTKDLPESELIRDLTEVLSRECGHGEHEFEINVIPSIAYPDDPDDRIDVEEPIEAHIAMMIETAKQQAKVIIEARKRKADEVKAAAEQHERARQEARERAEYTRLAAKFEGGGA